MIQIMIRFHLNDTIVLLVIKSGVKEDVRVKPCPFPFIPEGQRDVCLTRECVFFLWIVQGLQLSIVISQHIIFYLLLGEP
jgi:hypothetical protein